NEIGPANDADMVPRVGGERIEIIQRTFLGEHMQVVGVVEAALDDVVFAEKAGAAELETGGVNPAGNGKFCQLAQELVRAVDECTGPVEERRPVAGFELGECRRARAGLSED